MYKRKACEFQAMRVGKPRQLASSSSTPRPSPFATQARVSKRAGGVVVFLDCELGKKQCTKARSSVTYCPRCGAELAPNGRCRFAVPEEEAPWLADGTAEDVDRETLLPLARWLLHHPEAAAGRLRWARRTAGVEGEPGPGTGGP